MRVAIKPGYGLLLAIVAAVAASARDFSGHPECAIPCLRETVPEVGCSLPDTACICAEARLEAIDNLIEECLDDACDDDEQDEFSSVMVSSCASYFSSSFVFPTPSSSASESSSSSPSSSLGSTPSISGTPSASGDSSISESAPSTTITPLDPGEGIIDEEDLLNPENENAAAAAITPAPVAVGAGFAAAALGWVGAM